MVVALPELFPALPQFRGILSGRFSLGGSEEELFDYSRTFVVRQLRPRPPTDVMLNQKVLRKSNLGNL